MNWKKILLIVIIFVVALGISGWMYFKYNQRQTQQIQFFPNSQEQKIEDQLKQLDVLRNQYDVKPLTEQQINQQLHDLGQSGQASTSAASKVAPTKLTEQQIQQQLNTLQKLRSQ